MIETRNYLEYPNISSDIKPLFLAAFPEEERPPVDIFFSSFNKKNNYLYGFYDKNEFIGFISIIIYKDICYLFFLAVKKEMRNQGYGSQMIQIIKDMYKQYTLLLCYEEVDEKYNDYLLRKKREQFYLKNGFRKNPLKTNEFGVIFQTAVYGNRFVSFEEYKEIFISGFGRHVQRFLKKV